MWSLELAISCCSSLLSVYPFNIYYYCLAGYHWLPGGHVYRLFRGDGWPGTPAARRADWSWADPQPQARHPCRSVDSSSVAWSTSRGGSNSDVQQAEKLALNCSVIKTPLLQFYVKNIDPLLSFQPGVRIGTYGMPIVKSRNSRWSESHPWCHLSSVLHPLVNAAVSRVGVPPPIWRLRLQVSPFWSRRLRLRC